MRACKHEEIEKIFRDRDVPSETLYYLALCYYSALRVSEALNYNGSEIITGKGGHERYVYFSEKAEKYGAIKKQKLTRYALCNRLYRVSKRILGYRISPHDLRRSRATTLYKKTQDILSVQALLGHKDTVTTFQYIVYSDNDVEKTYRICFKR
ncbi:putative phage integrase [Candidatus Termititenax persephonae]|uniref:Phage integrase n=1 Tax=Candidatus Termititenax persephonae TaxID=2218525 RepID=A0A388TFZ0_9BACT|nr:putative phage integrase [Candidatus Termititenax persephonae]